MIETRTCYPDGITKQVFDIGCIYQVKDEIVDAFLSMGWAENVLEIETPEKLLLSGILMIIQAGQTNPIQPQAMSYHWPSQQRF